MPAKRAARCSIASAEINLAGDSPSGRVFTIERMDALKQIALLLLSAVLAGSSCAGDDAALLPARENSGEVDASGLRLMARLVHLTDTHVVDTLSPARYAGAHELVSSAWRPWERYSTQILDGIIRTANRIHASGETVDFLLHTGDACDNSQYNELAWFLAVMDGRELTPLSGPDNRPEASRPPASLDPYAPFQPQGLYQAGVHGDRTSIPWYSLLGNHDTFAIGVFPILDLANGGRIAPLPLSGRPGVVIPRVLDPTGAFAYGFVTPANPGPPPLLDLPLPIVPSPERAFFDPRAFIRAAFETRTTPAGHGFTEPENGPAWYSVSPSPGLRLIGLDTSDVISPLPGLPYHQGSVSRAQVDFLRGELDGATERGERVIVASHHPSGSLEVLYGSVLGPEEFRALLNAYPAVVLHLAGHEHRNRVADRGGYVEIETCSTIDPPQEARIVELWQGPADGAITVRYRVFSYLDDALPPVGDDPLRALREEARRLTAQGRAAYLRQRAAIDPLNSNPEGSAQDREGEIRLGR